MSGSRNAAEYACAILVRDSKVLLGRRAPFRASYPNCWDFIGGKVEDGETSKEALARELGEELAITPSRMTYFASLDDKRISPDSPPTCHFYFVRDWDGGEPSINNHEHTHLDWFSLQQACDLSNLALPDYRHLLTTALTSPY